MQADLLPVMNVMFLLIPALLLAMEFASMASISVSAPRVGGDPTTNPAKPPQPELEFKVTIGRDGFRTTTSGQTASTIPLDGTSHDFSKLASIARDLKLSFPTETSVTITAEGDIPMDVLVQTIDTLRGNDCKLSAFARGEQPGDQCLFWHPVIMSMG